MRKTMLKKEDWGGLAILSLLATIAFPPYFVHLMTMAALTELGHLWTTRLDRLQKDQLIEFEKEFRKGYQMEKEGNRAGALQWYKQLEKQYESLPQASKLATLQIRKIEEAGIVPTKPGRGVRKKKS
jgi:hypothetical protein